VKASRIITPSIMSVTCAKFCSGRLKYSGRSRGVQTLDGTVGLDASPELDGLVACKFMAFVVLSAELDC
jgi:hypothetical protein